MPKRFLNVEYAGIRTRINIADFEDLSEVQDAIKAKCGEDVPGPASRIQLYDQQGQHIQDLEDVPEDYFKKQRNGGLFLVIRTSPPPGRETSQSASSITFTTSGPLDSQTVALIPPIATATSKGFAISGPVAFEKNFGIPVDTLTWGKEVLSLVKSGNSLLLHGPWQSGKTSTLQFLKSWALRDGRNAYYIDLLAGQSVLQSLLLHNYSMYQFLAAAMCGSDVDKMEHFDSAAQFCRKIAGKETKLPLMLLDEYDALLHVSRSDNRLLVEMNMLVSHCVNSGEGFYSIVCAGTFSIVETQTQESQMDVDEKLTKQDSDDSFDKTVQPFSLSSPWNKLSMVEAKPFENHVFKEFCKSVTQELNQQVDEAVMDDIWTSTMGHPGFSMFLLFKATVRSVEDGRLELPTWLETKRYMYMLELAAAPTLRKMIERVKKSKKVAGLLLKLLYENEVANADSKQAAFLRAVGVAQPADYNAAVLQLSSPIIRDALLREFCPPFDGISAVGNNAPQSNYLLYVLRKAIPYFNGGRLLDKLVIFSKGLSEASVHAELYRILCAMYRNFSDTTILTESKVVNQSNMRCDIWIKGRMAEFGIELKSELNNDEVQKAVNAQLVRYASTRAPSEMILVNFVMKQEASVSFPIKIATDASGKYQNTKFVVLFVRLSATSDNHLNFSMALNGDQSWQPL